MKRAALAHLRASLQLLTNLIAGLLIGGLLAAALLAGPPAFAQEVLGLDAKSLRAQLSPVRQATLSAEMAGKIQTLRVREGQAVKQGAVLIEFECSVPRAQLEKAQIEKSIAENTHQGNLKLSQLNAIGAVELNNSELAVQKAQAEVSFLKAVLGRCSVRAPYSGHVSALFVNDSEFVQTGAKLMEVQDGSALDLEFIAPSAWLSALKKGREFEVSIEDTGKVYKAVVTYTNVKIDPMSQSVKVTASIKGNHPELLAGMSGIVHLDANPVSESKK